MDVVPPFLSPLGAPESRCTLACNTRGAVAAALRPKGVAQQRADTEAESEAGEAGVLQPTRRRGEGAARCQQRPQPSSSQPHSVQRRGRRAAREGLVSASHETSPPPPEAETFPTRQAALVGPAPSGVPAAPPQTGTLAAAAPSSRPGRRSSRPQTQTNSTNAPAWLFYELRVATREMEAQLSVRVKRACGTRTTNPRIRRVRGARAT